MKETKTTVGGVTTKKKTTKTTKTMKTMKETKKTTTTTTTITITMRGVTENKDTTQR